MQQETEQNGAPTQDLAGGETGGLLGGVQEGGGGVLTGITTNTTVINVGNRQSANTVLHLTPGEVLTMRLRMFFGVITW